LTISQARQILLDSLKAIRDIRPRFKEALREGLGILRNQGLDEFQIKALPKIKEISEQLNLHIRAIEEIPATFGLVESDIRNTLDKFLAEISRQYKADKVVIYLSRSMRRFLYSYGLTEKELTDFSILGRMIAAALSEEIEQIKWMNSRRDLKEGQENLRRCGIYSAIKVGPSYDKWEEIYDNNVYIVLGRSEEGVREYGEIRKEAVAALRADLDKRIDEGRAPWVAINKYLHESQHSFFNWFMTVLRHNSGYESSEQFYDWIIEDISNGERIDSSELVELLESRTAQDITISALDTFIQILEAGIDFKARNITPYLREKIERFREIAEAKGLEFVAELSAEPLMAERCDLNLLGIVVDNLIQNAIKYTQKGRITVRLFKGMIRRVGYPDKEPRGCAVLEVEDTGMGIPKEERYKIFSAGYRASNVGSVLGTGVGLNAVSHIVHLMEGNNDVYSELGKGSTFSVILPLSSEQSASSSSPAMREEDRPGVPPGRIQAYLSNVFRQVSAVMTLKGRPLWRDKKCLFSVTNASAPVHSVYAAINASAGLRPIDSYFVPISKGTTISSSMLAIGWTILINSAKMLGWTLRLTSLIIVRGICKVCFGKESTRVLKIISEAGFFTTPTAATNSFVSRMKRKLFLPQLLSNFAHLFDSFFHGHSLKRGRRLGRKFTDFLQTLFDFFNIFSHSFSPLTEKIPYLLNSVNGPLRAPEVVEKLKEIKRQLEENSTASSPAQEEKNGKPARPAQIQKQAAKILIDEPIKGFIEDLPYAMAVWREVVELKRQEVKQQRKLAGNRNAVDLEYMFLSFMEDIRKNPERAGLYAMSAAIRASFGDFASALEILGSGIQYLPGSIILKSLIEEIGRMDEAVREVNRHRLNKGFSHKLVVLDGQGGYFVDTLGFEGKWQVYNLSKERLTGSPAAVLRVLKSLQWSIENTFAVSIRSSEGAINEIDIRQLDFQDVYVFDDTSSEVNDIYFMAAGQGNHFRVTVYIKRSFLFKERAEQREEIAGIFRGDNPYFIDSSQPVPYLKDSFSQGDEPRAAFLSLGKATKYATELLTALLLRANIKAARRDIYSEKLLEAHMRDLANLPEFSGSKPNLFCISLINETIGLAKETIVRIRSAFPDAYIIVGGPSTQYPEQLASFLGDFDFLIRGEGDDILIELINLIAGLDRKEGVTAEKRQKILELEGGLIYQPSADSAVPVSIVNRISHTNIAENFYLPLPRRPYQFHCLYTSNGCEGNCAFCNRHTGHLKRCADNSLVVEWLLYRLALEPGPGFPQKKILIIFNDDDFLVDVERVDALCEEFIRLGFSDYFEFRATFRVLGLFKEGQLNTGLIDKMWDAGFRVLAPGFDGLSESVLRHNRKGGYNLDRHIIPLYGYLKKKGFSVSPNLIVLTPDITFAEAVEHLLLTDTFVNLFSIGLLNPGIIRILGSHFNNLDFVINSHNYRWNKRGCHPLEEYNNGECTFFVPRGFAEYAFPIPGDFGMLGYAEREAGIIEELLCTYGRKASDFLDANKETAKSVLESWLKLPPDKYPELTILAQLVDEFRKLKVLADKSIHFVLGIIAQVMSENNIYSFRELAKTEGFVLRGSLNEYFKEIVSLINGGCFIEAYRLLHRGVIDYGVIPPIFMLRFDILGKVNLKKYKLEDELLFSGNYFSFNREQWAWEILLVGVAQSLGQAKVKGFQFKYSKPSGLDGLFEIFLQTNIEEICRELTPAMDETGRRLIGGETVCIFGITFQFRDGVISVDIDEVKPPASSPAEGSTLPGSSPFRIFEILSEECKGKSVTAEQIRLLAKGRAKDGHLSAATIKRDLGTLVYLELAEKNEDAKYRAADLSPPQRKAIELILQSLGNRPTKIQKQAAEITINAFKVFKRAATKDFPYLLAVWWEVIELWIAVLEQNVKKREKPLNLGWEDLFKIIQKKPSLKRHIFEWAISIAVRARFARFDEAVKIIEEALIYHPDSEVILALKKEIEGMSGTLARVNKERFSKDKFLHKAVMPDGKGGYFVDTLGFEGRWLVYNMCKEPLECNLAAVLRALKSLNWRVEKANIKKSNFRDVYILDSESFRECAPKESWDNGSYFSAEIINGNYRISAFFSREFLFRDREEQRNIMTFDCIRLGRKFPKPDIRYNKGGVSIREEPRALCVSLSHATKYGSQVIEDCLKRAGIKAARADIIFPELLDSYISDAMHMPKFGGRSPNIFCISLGDDGFREEIGREVSPSKKVSYPDPSRALINRLIAKIRVEFPGAYVIIGGPSLSYPEQIAALLDDFDFLVRGEGEEILLELAGIIKGCARDNMFSAKQIERILALRGGIIYKSPRNSENHQMIIINRICHTNWAKTFHLPLPRQAEKIHYLQTSRGCPWDCAFCDKYTGRRIRSVDNAELVGWFLRRLMLEPEFALECEGSLDKLKVFLTGLAQKGEKIRLAGPEDKIWIDFHDDDFLANRNRVRAFCEEAIRMGLENYFQFMIINKHQKYPTFMSFGVKTKVVHNLGRTAKLPSGKLGRAGIADNRYYRRTINRINHQHFSEFIPRL